MSQSYAIQCLQVEKKFEQFHFGPVNIQIEPGYVTAVVGPNGSGKSTLFRLLMNILKPDSGDITLWGSHFQNNEVDLKDAIGYIPDQHFWDKVDCRTIKELAEYISPWYSKWNDRLYRELLAKYDLDDRTKLTLLSKGMKQKLAFVFALAHEPDLLLLDELSSGVDPFMWKKMIEDLTQFMDNGKRNIVFSTHVLDEVRRLADYVLFMSNGKVVGIYEKDALLDNWKAFWVEQVPGNIASMPEVISIEKGTSIKDAVKIVTDQAGDIEAALRENHITATATRTLELDEILTYILRKNEGVRK